MERARMQATDDQPGYWVLIETGSNQEFILQSTRRRFQVGASGLVKDLERWVDEAIAAVNGDLTPVVKTSSKALLRVTDRDTGRKVVEKVTTKALRAAPGLDIWGYVDDESTEPGDAQERLPLVHARHAALRWSRPSPQQRFPQRPFLDTCPITATPPSVVIPDPTTAKAKDKKERESRRRIPASALTDKAYDRAYRAIQDLQKRFGGAIQRNLDEELTNGGWVAVVHADGNSLGNLITSLASPEELAGFSRALTAVTEAAFGEAVESLARENWIVPLIIGGDDVTFVCDGRHALAVTRAYLAAFERHAAATEAIAGPAQRETGRRHLTACAGIAFVKPHFPFHAAHELAEQLCRSAKTATKANAEGRSSYDFHVVHDSVVRPLSVIRAGLRRPPGPAGAGSATLDLWSGPFLAPSGVAAANTGWAAEHEDQILIDDVDLVLEAEVDRTLSGSAMHQLRQALMQPHDEVLRRTIERVAASSADAGVTDFLGRNLPSGRVAQGGCSRFMAVLDAADMRSGVLAGPRRVEGGNQ
ncbi:Cas10/Cmr2 second palm domain-containing protein [Micropruina sp.]|uniref:Cas10/Cmr2 second palm domain-containing protein n=1 Tax=Micropruina sp. TaxID=2737536 RepID=UPI0039E50EBD